MAKFYIYLDYGSGFVNVNPFRTELKLGLRRGEINNFIYRKFLEGNFTLQGTEFTTAKAYFVTAGNLEAPIRIYENGLSGVGTLKYEGWAKINGEYNNNEETVTFNSFRTNDIYSAIISILDRTVISEQLGTYGSAVDRITFQGLNTNSNKLQAYTWSGTAWVSSGNSYAQADIGRCALCAFGTGIAAFDASTNDLRKFVYSAPNFSPSANGTSLVLNSLTGNASIVGYTATTLAFIDDYYCNLRIYTETTGTWTLSLNQNIEKIKYPSLGLIATGYLALVDEGTGNIRAFSGVTQVGQPYNLGTISKPKISSLDSASGNIALVDATTQSLRVLNYNTGTGVWTEIGTPYNIGTVIEPDVSFESTNVVNVYDSNTGNLQKFTYSAGTWTQTGNTTSIGGGYCGQVSYIGTSSVLAFLQSDSYVLDSRLSWSYRDMMNNIADYIGNSYTMPDYRINATDGASFDIDKVYIGDLNSMDEIYLVTADQFNRQKLSLKKMFEIAEMMQNYWYLEYTPGETLSDYSIKFTQPNLFSSIGTDIDVSSLIANLDRELYSEVFNTDKEEIIFKNDINTNIIDYERNTGITLTKTFDYTTNFDYFIQNLIGLQFDFSKDGLFLMYGAISGNRFVCEAGTGPDGDTNTKNEKLRIARIIEDFWKDYRYASFGTFELNGNSVAVQDTVRDMISYPDILFKESAVGITEFPDDIASLDWGGGKKTFITELSVDLSTYQYTAKSILLDL